MDQPGDEDIVETHPSVDEVQESEPKTVADLEAEVAAEKEAKPKRSRARKTEEPTAEEEAAEADTGADAPADAEPEVVEAAEPEPVAAAPQGRGPIQTPADKIAASQDSRVSVVNESRSGDDDDEYQWHTGLNRPHGQEDAVEFIDVHKAFGRNKILRGLNMGLPEGKISMILGPSGTGKSVCIKHMVGLLYPDEGDILVHGDSVPNMQDDDLFEMRKKFGVLFQDGALFGSMNVLDNTAFPLRQHTDKGEDEIMEIVNRRLQEVGLADAGDKMPNELSGGMRKRAGFARALVLDPDIVLFDEPDSGLDPVRTALLGELIQEIHEEMMNDPARSDRRPPAFCIITHDIMTARRVAEHISVLWKGRIVESGPAEELFNSDNAFVRQFLSGESQGPLGME
jgi:phospholipid/cholesterol/gamma-HCH transport system ATP-binding protein